MKVRMLKNAKWATDPALGNVEELKKGQELDAGYSDKFKAELLDCGHAEIVAEKKAAKPAAKKQTPAKGK